MIGSRRVLSGENCIANVGLGRGEFLPISLGPGPQTSFRERLRGIEPPAMRRRRTPLGIVRKAAAGSGVGSRRIAVRCGERLRDVGACAEAGIGEASRLQRLQRIFVCPGALRLNERRVVPIQSEPAQILEDSIDEFGAAARLVEVLDPQQEFSAGLARPRVSKHRTKSVPQVKPPRRRRREAGYEHLTCCRKDS